MRKEAHRLTIGLKINSVDCPNEQPGPRALRSPSLTMDRLKQFPIPIFDNGPFVYSIFQKFVATS